MTDSTQVQTRIGRPRSEAAESHEAIMDAVYALLQEKSVRDLSMEAVAKRAGVGKPTLYKWWPSKASLILAMFHERMVHKVEAPDAESAEAIIRAKAHSLVDGFNGLFGKVMAELIAEGQHDPDVLRDLNESLVSHRRSALIADIEHGISTSEFVKSTEPDLLVDMIFGPLFYRFLLRVAPVTREYADELIDGALEGRRRTRRKSGR
jgi:AcrR family transcriptional regulator